MSILSKLQALLTAANTTTGQSDTTLTDAVQTLVDGYGGGVTGTFSVEEDATVLTKITDVATIGFTPSIFILYNTIVHTTESTQYGVLISGYDAVSDFSIKYYERYSNTTGGRAAGAIAENWSTSTSGYLHLDNSGNIYHRGSNTSILLGGESYNWIALP